MHNTLLDSQLISVRDLIEEDIPQVIAYWHDSPRGFIENMGVDLNKLPSRIDMERALREKCRQRIKSNALTVVYNGRAIGAHTINPLIEGDYGIFHAHIWSPQMRQKGIAMFSYPRACEIFMRRFNLKRILFKTPAQNIGSIRVKEKLEIRYIGEETVGFGIVKDGTLAKVFELTSAELEFLIRKIDYPDVDISQLEFHLSLSYEERLNNHQRALELLNEILKARKELYGESESSPETPT